MTTAHPGAPAQRTPPRRRASGLLGNVSPVVIVAVLVALLLGGMLRSIAVGAVPLEPAAIIESMWRGATGAELDSTDYIVWMLRTPRTFEAVLVGAGLALAGAVVQVLVRNPIADPYVLGLSSGAGVGAVATVGTTGAFVSVGMQGGALIGAFVTGVVVAALATMSGGLAATRLVLVGIATAHLASGIMSFLIVRSGDADVAQQVMYWMLGSLAGAQWPYAGMLLLVIGLCLILLTVTAPWLDALALGDTEAAALGLRPNRIRSVLFVIACALTAAVVSVSGTIGFIGFVVPNLARLLVGGMHRRMIPVCALLGALLVLGADIAARTILAPSEVPIGILTAAIGVPIFVVVVRRGHRESI